MGRAAGFALAGMFAVGVALGAPAGKPPQVQTVTFEIHHRVFPDFLEESHVRMQQNFQIGDSQYSGRVVQFVPHFNMNLKTHKIESLSNEPVNPAFRIIVREKGAPRDTVWAFLNMPPHFARKSMLAFLVKRIDFVGRAPMLSDTTAGAVKP
jgi:hypothetical protein